MPQLHTNTPSAPRVPGVVVNLETLWNTGMIKIHIPVKANKGETNEDGVIFHCLQFKRGVHGGVINFRLYGEPSILDSYRGDNICAEFMIIRKDFADGRSFLQVDLRPMTVAELPTYELYVLGNLGAEAKRAIPYAEMDFMTFETPQPLKGALVIVSRKAKLLSNGAAAKTGSSKPSQAEVITGNSTVDRMITKESWVLAGETDDAFNLTKEGGKTMAYPKPKSKGNKKKR